VKVCIAGMLSTQEQQVTWLRTAFSLLNMTISRTAVKSTWSDMCDKTNASSRAKPKNRALM
jgi:hypothetical protein